MEIKVDNDSIEKLVLKQVRVAVVEALSGKSDYIVERIVDEALKKPAKDRYGCSRGKTIVEQMTDDTVREAATEAANEWLKEQKPKIKALIARKLGAKTKGLVASVAEQMTASFETGFKAKVWFDCDR